MIRAEVEEEFEERDRELEAAEEEPGDKKTEPIMLDTGEEIVKQDEWLSEQQRLALALTESIRSYRLQEQKREEQV